LFAVVIPIHAFLNSLIANVASQVKWDSSRIQIR